METWSHRAHPACGCGNGTQWIPQSAAFSVPLLRDFVVQSLNQCLPLCDPMDCSPPGSSVHGILQARILESVAISFSRESSQPRDQTHFSLHWKVDSFPLSHQGSPSESTTLTNGINALITTTRELASFDLC